MDDEGNEKTEFNMMHERTTNESPSKMPRQTTESDAIKDQVNVEISRLQSLYMKQHQSSQG